MTRRGRFAGTTSHYKKAIVTVKAGETINLFENV
jgi:ribosomal protein L23